MHDFCLWCSNFTILSQEQLSNCGLVPWGINNLPQGRRKMWEIPNVEIIRADFWNFLPYRYCQDFTTGGQWFIQQPLENSAQPTPSSARRPASPPAPSHDQTCVAPALSWKDSGMVILFTRLDIDLTARSRWFEEPVEAWTPHTGHQCEKVGYWVMMKWLHVMFGSCLILTSDKTMPYNKSL